MSQRRKRVASLMLRRRALLFVVLVACVAGCAVPQMPGRVIYEDPTAFVRVEPDPRVDDDDPGSFNRHPAELSVEGMAGILDGLKVREHRLGIYAWMAGQAPWEPVFSEEEIAILAPQLSKALAQADPNERVTYYLSRPQTSIKREITTGGLYLKGNRVHFILANRNFLYGVPAHGFVYDRRYPTRPTGPKWFDLDFEPSSALIEQKVTLVDILLGRETDELVIDLGSLGFGLPLVRAPGSGLVQTAPPLG